MMPGYWATRSTKSGTPMSGSPKVPVNTGSSWKFETIRFVSERYPDVFIGGQNT